MTRRKLMRQALGALGLGAAVGGGVGVSHAQRPVPQTVVFETPINLVSVPTNSLPIRNVGQAMHLLLVTFHFVGVPVAVSGFDVALEWSRDGVNWRPAGPSITTAPLLNYGDASSDVVAYKAYYGAFRAIRVAANYTGVPELDVYYTGQVIPVDPFVTLTNNRWVF